MFIVVFDDKQRADLAKQLLLTAGYDVFALNDNDLLVRTDNKALSLTDEIAVTARIKGDDRVDGRAVVFELGLGRSGYHKSALWEWIGR